MRKLPAAFIRRMRETLAKRMGWARKTTAKPKQVYNAEIVTNNAAEAGSIRAEGGIVRYGANGLDKVSRSEGAIHSRVFGKTKITKPASLRASSTVGKTGVLPSLVSKSKKFSKAYPLLTKTGKFVGGAAAWYGVSAGVDYLLDKVFSDGTFVSEEEQEARDAVAAAAQEALAEITKAGDLEDLLNSSIGDGSIGSQEATYNGADINHDSEMVKRLMKDLKLQASGEVRNQSDLATLRVMAPYHRSSLILSLVGVIKAIAREGRSPEVHLLQARQAMSSSLDINGWTEGFEDIVRAGNLESTATEAIASEYNLLYEGLFEEHRNDIGNTYFNEVTNLINLKSDRSQDFAINEASGNSVLAKLRLALASMVIDDSFADVQGWFDKLKVDEDKSTDDEYMAASEMIRYSTLGSDFISQFIYALRNETRKRESLLDR